jgi:serine/threonine protein kinase
MFSVRDLLGAGAFGVVLLVINRVTKEKSALKIINKETLSERAQSILKNESTIMRTMNHASVVSLKRIFENYKFIFLEMELVPGGELRRLLKIKDQKGNPKPLTDLNASKVMESLLKGVAYVHARDIVHRDLKPENILLADLRDDCHDVKIVDFGLSAEQNWRSR